MWIWEYTRAYSSAGKRFPLLCIPLKPNQNQTQNALHSNGLKISSPPLIAVFLFYCLYEQLLHYEQTFRILLHSHVEAAFRGAPKHFARYNGTVTYQVCFVRFCKYFVCHVPYLLLLAIQCSSFRFSFQLKWVRLLSSKQLWWIFWVSVTFCSLVGTSPRLSVATYYALSVFFKSSCKLAHIIGKWVRVGNAATNPHPLAGL